MRVNDSIVGLQFDLEIPGIVFFFFAELLLSFMEIYLCVINSIESLSDFDQLMAVSQSLITVFFVTE